MISRVLIVLAVLVYGGLWFVQDEPDAAAEAPASSVAYVRGGGDTYRAVGMQVQRVDWIDRYKQSINEVADLGADSVKLVVDARQEDAASTRIYLDHRTTPSVEQVRELVAHAKARGLRVILMPIVLLDDPKHDSEWRGTLAPSSWDDWFTSYREMILHWSWVAEGAGVDVLVVGSELISSQDKQAQWRELIAEVRGTFGGRLTYSSNWDRYAAVPFWDALDLIGMNSYWRLGTGPEADVEEIVGRWREVQSDLLPFVREQGKPLLLTEVGWTSMSNAAHEPWDYTTSDPIDLDLQRRLYEGFFEAWRDIPELGGYSLWEWPPGDGGPTDRGYTPEGKPAADVLREEWGGVEAAG